jgi:hypothetical protein
MEVLLEIVKGLAFVVGGGGLLAVLQWWGVFTTKSRAVAEKKRRDDQTYIHDGYRELFEKATARAERLEGRTGVLEQKVIEAKDAHAAALHEIMEERAENSQLKSEVSRLKSELEKCQTEEES